MTHRILCAFFFSPFTYSHKHCALGINQSACVSANISLFHYICFFFLLPYLCLFLLVLCLEWLSEFAALLLNTENGLVESLFHHFVRPTQFPELSEYCIRSTELTQTFIDRQESFDGIYNKFLCWLRQNIVKRTLIFATPQTLNSSSGLNATFCTWSDWDFGHYLYRDCVRNDKSRYECMKSWIDVRRTFDVSFSLWSNLLVIRFVFVLELFIYFCRFFHFNSNCFTIAVHLRMLSIGLASIRRMTNAVRWRKQTILQNLWCIWNRMEFISK